MTGQFLPGAVWRPVAYRLASGSFTTTPLGWILHVVVGNGSPFGGFAGATGAQRRFSTGWVAKDGSSEQYRELGGKPWAQSAGNGQYWAFETEGYPNEPLTDAQINTLAVWHNYLGAADAVIDAVGGRGIGTHVMGGLAWGNHSCPGPGPRAGQRAAIIARARELRNGPTPAPTPAPTPTQEETDMRDQIETMYRKLLGREAGVDETDNRIIESILTGRTMLQHYANIKASDESEAHAAYVTYAHLLGRKASPAEAQYWVTNANGPDEIIAKIAGSKEAADFAKLPLAVRDAAIAAALA